jgi:hypothetical protein
MLDAFAYLKEVEASLEAFRVEYPEVYYPVGILIFALRVVSYMFVRASGLAADRLYYVTIPW